MHPRPDVRAFAAVAFKEGLDHGPDLPDDLRPAWRTALVGANPNHGSQHFQWRLQEILKHVVVSEPALFTDWFIANAATLRAMARSRIGMASRWLSDILENLPREQKLRVCTSLNRDDLLASGFAGTLLASDPTLTEELLRDAIVDGDSVLRSMSGYRDHTVEGLAPALVKVGASDLRK